MIFQKRYKDEARLLQVATRKWYLAHQTMPFPTTFSDLQAFPPTANLFRCNFLWLIYLAVSATAVSCPLIIHVDISLLHWTAQPFYGPFSGTTWWAVARENLGTLWCKGRLTEADTLTIWPGATPSRLSSAHCHHPPFLQAGCPSSRPTNSVKALKATSAFGLGRRC